MIITCEYIYNNPSIDSIYDIIKTVSKEHNEKYGYNDFYKTTVIGNIQFIDQTNNKTKNITVNNYYLKHRARKTTIASRGSYRSTKINKVSIIFESEAEKHVINNYLKMKIQIMWRNSLKILLKIEIIYRIIVIIHIENSIDVVLIGICIMG